MEDTYSIKDLVRNLIAEVKQMNSLKDTHKQNTIEFDDYFKYSGKIEKSTRCDSTGRSSKIISIEYDIKNR